MSEKQYLVSESELIRILDYAFGHVTEIENYIKDVLKSKQPTELLAEGEVKQKYDEETGDYVTINNKDMVVLLEEYDGKPVKIFIQEVAK